MNDILLKKIKAHKKAFKLTLLPTKVIILL